MWGSGRKLQNTFYSWWRRIGRAQPRRKVRVVAKAAWDICIMQFPVQFVVVNQTVSAQTFAAAQHIIVQG